MINAFEELLGALGKVFDLNLRIDRSNACSIQLRSLVLQLQLDVSQENLWIFSKLIEVPPGRFRENVLKEALKANSLPDPRVGAFGYVAASNHLALFQNYPLTVLNGDRLAGLIGAFIEMAEGWRKAVASGQTAPPSTRQAKPFGLK